MLDAEAVQAAVLAAAGDVQSLMNHLGLAARSELVPARLRCAAIAFGFGATALCLALLCWDWEVLWRHPYALLAGELLLIGLSMIAEAALARVAASPT